MSQTQQLTLTSAWLSLGAGPLLVQVVSGSVMILESGSIPSAGATSGTVLAATVGATGSLFQDTGPYWAKGIASGSIVNVSQQAGSGSPGGSGGPASESVSDLFLLAQIAKSVGALGQPAQDGADVAGATMPAGGAGIRGWLSASYVTLTTILTTLKAAIPAGGNLIGIVGLDQTTPGTTNAVALPDGASVTLGKTTDAAATTQSISGSAIAYLRGIFVQAAALATTVAGGALQVAVKALLPRATISATLSVPYNSNLSLPLNTSAAAVVTLAVDTYQTASVQITGAAGAPWSGQASFLGSLDGGLTFGPLAMKPFGAGQTGPSVAVATGNGWWDVAVGTLTHLQVQLTSLTSGTPVVTLAAAIGGKMARVTAPASDPLPVAASSPLPVQGVDGPVISLSGTTAGPLTNATYPTGAIPTDGYGSIDVYVNSTVVVFYETSLDNVNWSYVSGDASQNTPGDTDEGLVARRFPAQGAYFRIRAVEANATASVALLKLKAAPYAPNNITAFQGGSPWAVATPLAAPVTGQLKIATTGTAVQLPAAALVNGLVVKASVFNASQQAPGSASGGTHGYTGAVGGSAVTTACDGTGTGYALAPGEAASFACANSNLVYVNGTVGDVFYFEGN